MSIEARIRNDTPSPVTARPGPCGSPVIGSGKFGTPCSRMHSAAATNCRSVAAVLALVAAGLLSGTSLKHVFWAA